jgi:1-acyl-sn-glycerol-3-phosphate acyltransferase
MATQTDLEKTAASLLDAVCELAREVRPGGELPGGIDLDSRLGADLGLDSLSIAELLLRIERRFDTPLPDAAIEAQTPRELLRLIIAFGDSQRGEEAATLRYAVPGAAPGVPAMAQTLPEVLAWHVAEHPERTHAFVYEQPDRAIEISYAQLDESARSVAAGLREQGLTPGQAAAIMLPTGREYLASFFGILLAGAIPVPIYPPARRSQIGEHLLRHARILSNARAHLLITVPEAKALARVLGAQVLSLRHILTVDELAGGAGDRIEATREPQDIAFLQYTSGSTGAPKGVVLSHANLLANIRAMGERVRASSTDVFVSWLPLYHDMGLIGAWLAAMYFGLPVVLMSPLSFMTRPARWLKTIDRHRGTLTAAPNFGYELCLAKTDDAEIEGIDLASLRIAFNGAEPVSPDTLRQFARRFSRYGLDEKALMPVYGLAETSVGLAIPEPGRGPVIDRVRRDVFLRSGRAEPAPADDLHPLEWVSCGHPLPGHQIRIVDAAGVELAERCEGRIEFQGSGTTSGYYRNPEATRRLFDGEWLDSGDRGYIADGDIYVTGRDKDVIIRGGRNIYPYELDEAIGNIPGIRKGCVAAFGHRTDQAGADRLIVVAETRETDAGRIEQLRKLILARTMDVVGIPPDEIVVTPPHAILKTSSGKIRRAATRELYARGVLGRPSRAPWRQLTPVTLRAIAGRLRRILRDLRQSAYSGYAWAVFCLLAPTAWLGVMLLPRSAWRWSYIRSEGRLLAWLTGTRLRVSGLDRLTGVGACVIAANHASYLDSLALAVAMPRPLRFVAKRELVERPFVGMCLRRLGVLFVERFDIQESASDMAAISRATRAGHTLAFFPEGTFTRMPGLAPFHMGAFVAAAQAGTPVVPVTIRGTRSILRSGAWWIRPGAVQVSIAEVRYPAGDDWAAAVALKHAVREAILAACGEPDLAGEGA